MTHDILSGKVALITGGGAGIGEAVARRFVDEGARVVIAELDHDAGSKVAADIGGVAIRTDASKERDLTLAVQLAVEEYGQLDILVNNAWGGGRLGPAEEKTPDLLTHAWELGVLGPFYAMRAAFDHMAERRFGRVINMCSLNGVNAHVGTLEYNIAKEALRSLTRTAAREWADVGIVVNALCPAARSGAYLLMEHRHPELAAVADAANPMGRLGDCYEDIAPAAVFLASDDCRYVTGNTIFVDGGAHISGVPWAPDLRRRTSVGA